jgi:uncharacterized membrane protein YidH (DUF202 family)
VLDGRGKAFLALIRLGAGIAALAVAIEQFAYARLALRHRRQATQAPQIGNEGTSLVLAAEGPSAGMDAERRNQPAPATPRPSTMLFAGISV